MTISYQPGIIPQWTVADRLRKARELTGMDQTEFAEHAGLSRAGVSNAERGQSTPRRSTLKLWALSTGVPLRWIETGEAPSPDGERASGLPQLDSNQQPFD
ncbi:helix-turn-helix domain-containing protein [Brachybacterium paraconglomeratum]|uniref:helix-turn-helix domain-containing protein n=1 Tax=Brachybacterium paraconglomeratum TaxID=173362 RepID=UPI00358DAE97